ncbi:proline oxidase [Fusarium heterosporum]|uniref:Proline dehydrogenase n=1 Tax=Fusarium heterosporum TaxID=42747 RepID=A0A8H5WIR3_FUSHE|nr:proline oxidase [Fusarium heterosporum]
MHSLERKNIVSPHHNGDRVAGPSTKPDTVEVQDPPLSILPLGMIIRSLLITSISSSTTLRTIFIRALLMLAHADNVILNPDRNHFLGFILKKTFYAQFCAGETPAEVRATIARLKSIGFSGVILTYAKEAISNQEETKVVDTYDTGKETTHDIINEIEPWSRSTQETIRLAEAGDYVAVKLTGCGRLAVHNLSRDQEPSPYLSQSMHRIFTLAQQRGVGIIFDAEQDTFQTGIDTWTMIFARTYNTADTATIYGTYQAYRKATPSTISRHLIEAQRNNFTLGVKLVRGAYLGSDPRHCFYDTKAETDICYNAVADSVLRRQWGPFVTGNGTFPNAHLVLATHNAESVRQARVICEAGKAKSEIMIAQLQGMADEVSCELIKSNSGSKSVVLPAYKYLVWGTIGECMKYLLRRAYENQDEIQRTQSGRNAMWVELVRRCKKAVRFDSLGM